MVSKTQQAISLFKAGDLKGALRLASGFRIGLTRQEKATLKRGFESMHSPQFYAQLGKNPDLCIKEATEVFKARILGQCS